MGNFTHRAGRNGEDGETLGLKKVRLPPAFVADSALEMAIADMLPCLPISVRPRHSWLTRTIARRPTRST